MDKLVKKADTDPDGLCLISKTHTVERSNSRELSSISAYAPWHMCPPTGAQTENLQCNINTQRSRLILEEGAERL